MQTPVVHAALATRRLFRNLTAIIPILLSQLGQEEVLRLAESKYHSQLPKLN